jgi:hypothetical protein
VHTPNNDVKMLPDTADSIFCPSDTSAMPTVLSASSALCVAVAMIALVLGRVYGLEGVRGVVFMVQGREKGGDGIVLVAFRVVTRAKAMR